jgi:hypothetical protein
MSLESSLHKVGDNIGKFIQGFDNKHFYQSFKTKILDIQKDSTQEIINNESTRIKNEIHPTQTKIILSKSPIRDMQADNENLGKSFKTQEVKQAVIQKMSKTDDNIIDIKTEEALHPQHIDIERFYNMTEASVPFLKQHIKLYDHTFDENQGSLTKNSY